MTIIGNAAKWALLMPFVILITAGVIGLMFGAGWGIASFFTDSLPVKMVCGSVAEAMGLGAFIGAFEAR